VKTLLITSTQNGEGKTTTALNLGQALAQRRFRVLLMDCDLRKGELAKAIGIDNHKGVAEILSGVLSVPESLRALEPNLWALPSGRIQLDPVALLASPEMAALLKSVASRFDFVVIDSPPVLAVTDAAILAGLVDGVLLVAASGTAQRVGLIRTRRILEASGARILGMAVNKVDTRRPGYGYSYASNA
jgi:capsular exopolysaccharide synthesis family protein